MPIRSRQSSALAAGAGPGKVSASADARADLNSAGGGGREGRSGLGFSAHELPLEPFTGGYYDNIEFERDDPEAAGYGPAYPRLTKIKAQYDPMNLFRLNSNIRPAAT